MNEQHIWKSPQQKSHLLKRIHSLKIFGLLKEENAVLLLTEKGTLKLQKEIQKVNKETKKRGRTKRHEKKIKKLST